MFVQKNYEKQNYARKNKIQKQIERRQFHCFKVSWFP